MRAAPGRADDEPHALGHLELVGDGLEALPVLRLRDLAGDAAAAAGVGHQHGVAAGERQIGRERRALAAALLLDDLHEDDLAALDHLLDLVGAHAPARPLRHLLQRVLRAHLLDRAHGLRGLGGVGDDLLDVAAVAGRLRLGLAIAGEPGAFRRVGGSVRLTRLVRFMPRPLALALRSRRRLTAQDIVAVRRLGSSRPLVPGVLVLGLLVAAVAIVRIVAGLGFLVTCLPLTTRTAAGLARLGAGIGLGLGLGFRLRLLGQQRLPVGDGDLIVVGMDFAEGQEAVAVAAVVDEGRLQRRLHARHLGEVDVAAQQLARGRFVVELLYPAVAEHHHPGFLGMGGVDEHSVVLVHVIGSLAPRRPA